MKVVCDHKDFTKSLNIISRAVPAKPTLPILGNVLFHYSNDKVTLTAYDLEMGIRHTFDSKTEGEGSLALPAKFLQEVIAHLPEGEITLEVDPGIRITARTETAEYDIHGISSEEYPKFPESKDKGSQFSVDGAEILSCLKKTTYASSKDSSRTWTSGIYILVEDKKLVMVATDGRRLALDRCPIDGKAPKDGIDALIPTKTMDDLQRILSMGFSGKIKVTISKNMTLFELGDTIIISHLLDAQFPDYQRVIPSEFKGKVTIDRDNFAQAIRGASIVAKQREGRDMTVLKTDAEFLIVSSHVENLGSSTQKMPVHIEGEELKVAFNYQFLLDPIQNIDNNEIELNYGTQLQPGLIRIPEDEDYLYVIMPVRLTE